MKDEALCDFDTRWASVMTNSTRCDSCASCEKPDQNGLYFSAIPFYLEGEKKLDHYDKLLFDCM